MAAETVGAVKIVGYLEKKGKLKVVTTWKKYWFVLEGRLLLYYRSQEEYENLSPCKGSINMGLATNIRPGLAAAGVFQIITRTSTVTLRAKERAIQEKWLQALLDATGQQTASNPIKMSHFRYSMDDLLPAGAKQTLTRQNTLPNRSQNKNDRHTTIINRIRQIGVQTYGGSLDTINQLSKVKTQLKKVHKEDDYGSKMSAKSITETDSDNDNEVIMKNDLYSGIIIENAQYISADETKTDPDKSDVDHNKNCYIVENDQYIKSDPLRNDTNSTNSNTSTMKPDDVEYYCTYEEVNATKLRPSSINIYQEPHLPPRPEEKKSELDDCACEKEEGRKVSKFMRFAMRFRSTKQDDSLKKKSASLIKKVIGKKKISEPNNVEPIYDTVDYLEIEKSEMQKAVSEDLVKTLVDLQHKLEEKKSQIKEIIKSGASSPALKEKKPMEENAENDVNIAAGVQTTVADMVNPPGLPPRRESRSRSPFHDTPKNNTPINQTDLSTIKLNKSPRLKTIDRILDDLEMESKKTDSKPVEELTVRQLIEKFNQSSLSSDESNLHNISNDSSTDVSLRQKCELTEAMNCEHADMENYLVNRHSDELNKLLEELTKVTSAPLLTPGVTSSLVQMKTEPLTDEEWLAITPIRRRRHSEPDYDVPRPHRSLQILPRSPDNEDNEENTVIPATRFFGPVLPPTITDKSHTDHSWNSMSPDSLEPLQLYQAAFRQRKLHMVNLDAEKDRSVGYEKLNNHNLELTVHNMPNGEKKEQKSVNSYHDIKDQDVSIVDSITVGHKPTDRYLDSLEPCGSALF